MACCAPAPRSRDVHSDRAASRRGEFKDDASEGSMPTVDIFRIFLASSEELKEDRRDFEIFIYRKNKDWVPHRGIFLDLVVWEDFLDALSKTRLQDEYNKRIRECDLFVMLFFTKVGPYTAEEFETAIGQFHKTSKPLVFTYFKDAQITTGGARKNDLQSMWAFQSKLGELGHFYSTYKNLEDLKLKFGGQLDKLSGDGFFTPEATQAAGTPTDAKAAAPAGVTSPDAGADADELNAAVKLLCATLLSGPAAEARARRLVDQIAALCGARRERLFDLTCHFVEHRLLTARKSEFLPADLLSDAGFGPLASRLSELAGSGTGEAPPIDVLSDFFARADEREELWKAYFDAVTRRGRARPETVTSLSRVRVKLGFIASQYLLAGLLARFDDDWRAVLNAYQRAIPPVAKRNSAFKSLQTSQWMCWLMWGPSVPLCTCACWRGLVAFQYGYGDENNSLPLLEVARDGPASHPALDALGQQLRDEHRGSRFAAVTGRLRWAPWFLRKEPATDEVHEFDLAAQDEVRPATQTALLGAAAAQAALYTEEFHPNLVLQLDKLESTNAETRVYYSAYLWLMFLVAVPPLGPEHVAAGLSLPRGKECPEWVVNEAERRRQRRMARLWEHLLPVFVHANIADPAALAFQKQMLVENALRLLREVWEQRHELFDSDDVAAGIRFHLVCASDYSGCGAPLRFAPADPLVAQLRQRQATEPDRAFAEALMLPAEGETEQSRPWALRGYFSACHLAELIGDYFDDVARKS
jgi:hypothetical protein